MVQAIEILNSCFESNELLYKCISSRQTCLIIMRKLLSGLFLHLSNDLNNNNSLASEI
ncbi:MAG: hypothetical protein ACLRFE_00330 [Clostridia bacterium]